MGPGTVPRDRFDYSTALSESWKSMMLLNIVKTRYLNLPIFLDVGQIVTGYSLETSLNINGSWATMGNGNALGLGSSGTYTDHPANRTFSSVLFLFTLADSGATQNLPTLTIPTR
jgi:hypothetical protein